MPEVSVTSCRKTMISSQKFYPNTIFSPNKNANRIELKAELKTIRIWMLIESFEAKLIKNFKHQHLATKHKLNLHSEEKQALKGTER